MRTLTAGAPVALADDDLLIAGDNLTAMATLPDGAFDMAYLDPPFNTGSEQRRGALAYADAFEDYTGFLAPRLERVRELLAPPARCYLHLDYREAHRCKLLLDELFGPDWFMNEIDLGVRLRRALEDALAEQARHDPLVRARPRPHVFNFDAMDRIPYMAPGLVTPEKAARGKTPSDVLVAHDRAHRTRQARRPATRRRSRSAS